MYCVYMSMYMPTSIFCTVCCRLHLTTSNKRIWWWWWSLDRDVHAPSFIRRADGGLWLTSDAARTPNTSAAFDCLRAVFRISSCTTWRITSALQESSCDGWCHSWLTGHRKSSTMVGLQLNIYITMFYKVQFWARCFSICTRRHQHCRRSSQSAATPICRQVGDDCQVYISAPSQRSISNYCQIVRLCNWRCTLVERQLATFEPGKDSPYLVWFTSASGEERRTLSAHSVIMCYNLGHRAGPRCHYGPSSHDVGACQLHMSVSILLPVPATSRRVIGVDWWSQDSSPPIHLVAYCNAVLYGISDILFWCLQPVQNVAAHFVTGIRRCDHITPVLQQLHWLPVWHRICQTIAS